MRELTTLEYRKCCVLVQQWRNTLMSEDWHFAQRILEQNMEFVRRYGKNPIPSEEDMSPSVRGPKPRKRHYGITPRMLGCWTIEIMIARLGLPGSFRSWLRRQNLTSPNLDKANHGNKPEWEMLERLFYQLVLVGYSEFNTPSSQQASDDAKRHIRDFMPMPHYGQVEPEYTRKVLESLR